MSKYKVGDKVVFTVTGMFGDVEYQYYALNKDFSVWEKTIDKYSELLSTYTEPLEAKIRRQAAEITRLLAENKELKNKEQELTRERNQLMGRCGGLSAARIKEFNNGRLAGQNEAWELVRKIFDMETNDIEDIFIKEDAWNLGTVLNNYTYQEATAKVAEWEKIKEIKVGDIVESNNGNGERIAVIDVWSSFDGLHFEGISSNGTLTVDASAKYYTKTGRHIDIGSFLKQIGGDE